MRRILDNLAPVLLVLFFGLLILIYTPIYEAAAKQPDVAKRAAVVILDFALLAASVALSVCLWTAGAIVSEFWRDVPARYRMALLGLMVSALAVAIWKIWNLGSVGGVLAAKLLKEVLKISYLSSVIRAQSYLLVLSVACVCTAVALLGWDVGERPASELALRMQRMRTLLYSSSALLGLAVFQLNRLLACGVVFSPQIKGGDSLVTAFSLGTGIAFTTLLVLLFVPASVQIDKRLHHLAAAEAQMEGEFNADLWRTRNGLPPAPLQDLMSIGAVVFPIVIGSITGG